MTKIISQIIGWLKKNRQRGSLVLFVTGILIFSIVTLNQKNELKSDKILVDTDFNIYNQKSNNNDVNSVKPPTPTIPDNYAYMSSPSEEIYNLPNFGLFSPLFVNKNVETIESKYKGALITSHYITIEDIKLSTWTIDKQEGAEIIDLPNLPERLLPEGTINQKFYDFPILDGYEWWFVVGPEKFISYRIPKNATEDKIYKNKRGLTFYKSFMLCPKSACGVKLQSHTYSANDKQQVYVVTLKEVNYFDLDEQELNNELVVAFSDLEKFADTLSTQVY